MIPLEKQVTSLELSQRLADLGEKQDSLFYWWHSEVEGWVVLYNPATIYRNEGYSAFTVTELGEALPLESYSGQIRTIKKGVTRWRCVAGFAMNLIYTADREADSRAKMLIYLIEKQIHGLKC